MAALPGRPSRRGKISRMAMATTRAPRLQPVLRDKTKVTPLELFFDLVFVLALTQCTALMADEPTWRGVAKGILILGVLWWSWVGYSWLTSLIDPEEGVVRIAIFVSMAALLVVALCVPGAFDDSALLFAGGYAVVRIAHIMLYFAACRDDANLRQSVQGLAVSTAIGVALIGGASFADGALQGALWAIALAIDMGGPFLFGAAGWRLVPEHFAERHGLILIIALGESIVAIGVGTEGLDDIDAGIVAAAVLGTAVAASLWWLYFDVVALVAERRLTTAEPGRDQNSTARDSYSLLHFPMVAGIVLLALGLKKTLEHVEDPLETVPACALLGGTAIYLLAHVAFRWRTVHRFSWQRLLVAAVACALIALAVELPALATLGILAAILIALIAFETVYFAELREKMRHQIAQT
jgi:low temperature requirement protein LtrA